MALSGILSLGASKNYTEESADALGAVKGAPCTILSVTPNADGSNTVVFEWTGTSGTKQTDSMIVPAGPTGATGETGATGKSAYEVAVENGFEGTEDEWLESLKGEYTSPPDTVVNGAMSGDLVPTKASQYSLGTPERPLAAVYADEIHMSSDTLYVNGVPVLHTDPSQDMLFTANEDQGIKVKTSGTASTNILSEKSIEVATTKEASNVNVTAGDMSASGSSNINVNASNNITVTSKNQITEKAPNIVVEASEGLAVKGGLQVDELVVSGNVTIKGEAFNVETTNTKVKDNIIEINSGESGTGVTAGSAGFKIDRGDAPDYELLFDETEDMFKMGKIGDLQTIASQEYVQNELENYAKSGEVPNFDNKTTLDKLSESDGTLLFDGEPIQGGGSGESGTSNYNDLINKPRINGIQLSGDKNLQDLGIYGLPSIENFSTKEQIVGTWVDDKPIYRKCGYCSANGVLSPNATSVIPASWANPTNLPNVKNIISAKIAQDGSSLLALRTLAPIQTSDGITVVWNYSNGYGFDTTTMIVLDYTKTTD